ncbi:phytoene/squalene synthase family protein [Oceanibaculum sp.]|uniref:phytoene/squalene synthase family protein n=1 Tax=Oceanibaculum sp. TaxID=1903597 RepID=UPI002590B15F|nr:phytoene/squalene synthase family protein [Oceanibaculum sp.]MCH2394815.1 phytoene/squalene synthase family protein [Oceanibaculum sp.]
MTDHGSTLPLLALAPQPRPASVNYGFTGDLADLRACSAAIRRGSKSFHLASLLLPVRVREATHALYGFCRHSDDLVDDTRAGPEALARLHDRLEAIYAGSPAANPIDRAFARVVRDHAIPKSAPLALLSGFAMDMEGRRYDRIGEVKSYATGVAASVGIMMAMVMGVGDASSLARAADLGIAMQLTNIARDVGEDARNGRLYLPRDWLAEGGIDADAFLRRPRFSPALAGVIRRLLEEADHHYRLGHAGIERLPPDCRLAIRTAALVYREIGLRLAAQGYDSVGHRAHTPLSRKLALVLSARRADTPLSGRIDADLPPDPAAAPLVAEATGSFALLRTAGPEPSSLPGASSIERVTLIMMRLELSAREENRARRVASRRKAAALA